MHNGKRNNNSGRLDVIIGIAETIQIIIEETGQKRKNIIADIETAVKVLEEGGKEIE